MNVLRDDIESLREKLIEENDKRLSQDKLIQMQQKNLILIINQVQTVIKSLTEGLPELDNKVRKKIDKQMKVLNDIEKKMTTNETTMYLREEMTSQMDLTAATTSNDPGGGNGNEKLNIYVG